MAGGRWFSLTSTICLLFYGCSRLGVCADCCYLAQLSLNTTYETLCGQLSTLGLPTPLVMDLNETFFINHIMIETATESYDSIDVDIGTTSCGSFDDNKCYITCSLRHVVQNSSCYVTMNVTCDVDNVKGRYVRIRPNNDYALVVCDVNITGFPDRDKVLKNFALRAQSSQSATYLNWTPNRAVDGNRNGVMNQQSCTHTDPPSKDNTQHIHWWQVDLGKLILVSYIIIANRVDCCPLRLANFTVELGRLESNRSINYTVCRYFDGVAGQLTNLTCTRSIWGQFVRISLIGETLTLCEVEVYGDTDDKQLTEMSLIPTDFRCDLSLSTSLVTQKITTATATSTVPTTEATIFQMISKNTSKAVVSTENPLVSSEAKVSTRNLQISSEAKVSTVNSEVMSEAKVSTVNPQVSSEAKVSTVNSEVMSEAKVSTVNPQVSSEAKVSTVNSEIMSEAKVSTVNPQVSSEAKVLTVNPQVTYEANVSTVNPQILSEAQVSIVNPQFSSEAEVSTVNSQILSENKVSTVNPQVSSEAKVSTVNPQFSSEAKVSTVNPQVLSEAKVSTVNPQVSSEAKVSTVNPKVSSEAKVSTVHPQFSSEAKVSTVNPQILSEAKVSTVNPQVWSEAKVSTVNPQVWSEAKVSTVNPEAVTEAKVSTENPQAMTEAKVSTENLQVSSEAKVSTVNPEAVTEAKVSTVNPEAVTEAKVSKVNPEAVTEAKVSTVNPEAVTEAKPSPERNFTSEIPVKHNCLCSCWNAMSKKNPEEVQEEMSQTAQTLKVKSSDLSQQVRKKSSVPDPRLSSTLMGVVSGIALSSIFGAIVLCDLCRLCHKTERKPSKKVKHRKGNCMARELRPFLKLETETRVGTSC
ncbi:uncharacterized protein LOC112565454 [Pomacea canaliculata]|nr:uncharacterized protein LOC112565454 [Pomacea canaliculata]